MTRRERIVKTAKTKTKQTSQTLLRGLKILELAASGKTNLPTLVGIEALKKHLAAIRRRGYSINFGEWHEDLGGVASAIRDREGHVVAAIAVTVPAHRLAKENIDRLGRFVMKAAAGISHELPLTASSGPSWIAIQFMLSGEMADKTQ
jgi:DNA-binding IclR family transcriptional regulator